MSFSITRAKYSLFIVGHLNTLKVKQTHIVSLFLSFLRNMPHIAGFVFFQTYRHWRALIDDAESRGTIIITKEQRYKLDARKILKEENIRSFAGPIYPNQAAHLPYPDTSRARLTFNDPQPSEYSYHPSSLGMVPYRSTFSRRSRGQYPTYRRGPWQDYSFNVPPTRHQTFRNGRDRHWSYEHDDHLVWDRP